MHQEIDILKNLFIEPEDFFGHLVNLALQTVTLFITIYVCILISFYIIMFLRIKLLGFI